MSAEQFRDFAAGLGYELPQNIVPGSRFRFSVNGKRADDAGWGTLFADGEGGVIGDWRTGAKHVWQAKRERKLSPAEQRGLQKRIERERRDAQAEREREAQGAAARADAIWESLQPAPADHEYLRSKGIKPHALRIYAGPKLTIRDTDCDGALVMALRNAAGEISSLEFIAPNGEKRFLPGGVYRGCYFSVGGAPSEGKPLCIAEGFSTAASTHEATGHSVAVAATAGNLEPVAIALRAKTRYADAKIIICADDDAASAGNPGLTKATDAARAIGGMLAVPDFGPKRPDGATDFNDLAVKCGPDAVRAAMLNARAPVLASAEAAEESAPVEPAPAEEIPPTSAPDGSEQERDDWPEPQPLVAKVEPEPYPLEALPATIRAAVEEVKAFIQAPACLVAASALGALSVAAQAIQDVRRAEKLQSPSGLFLLTIADSGERKTTCDAFFTAAIRDYEQEQAQAAKPDLARFAAENSAWEAKRDGVLIAIKQAAKTGKPANGKAIETLRAELVELENAKPQAPRVPSLIRGDDTPENLAWVLAHKWPSAGVITSEAGVVLGAHGMGKDSIMRNLALLNLLWDGGTLKIGRKTSDSFTVRGARLTVALQVQEATLRSFFDKSDGLARGTGFLSRFLVAWPESTQGTRPFSEAPQSWPALSAFHRRIRTLLDIPTPLDADGALSPAIAMLTPEAKAAWVAFHDAIEAELRNGGELFDVRDVAAKAADNAARLAAMFQTLEHGAGGAVGLEAFKGASRIVAWHLNEARRFFGELALPVEVANAARLDTWLVEYCRRGRTHIVPRREIQRNVTPARLRVKAALSEALRELADAGRIRELSEGRRKDVLVNPALLATGAA